MKNKYINKVLLCRPTYYRVEYEINPWMKKGSVDRGRALYEWETLVQTFEASNIQSYIVEQHERYPDMVFATDEGIVDKKNILLSNFRYKQRRGEQNCYLPWYRRQNLNIIHLKSQFFFEGGDAIRWRDQLFLGFGFRTDFDAATYISSYLDADVYTVRLIDPFYFHLDTCLFVLNDDVAFYYPKAFDQPSRDLLRRVIPKLEILTEEEAEAFAANSLVTDHHVIIPKQKTRFAERIKSFGYNPIEVSMNEFLKSGGGVHCLTQVIEEEYR